VAQWYLCRVEEIFSMSETWRDILFVLFISCNCGSITFHRTALNAWWSSQEKAVRLSVLLSNA